MCRCWNYPNLGPWRASVFISAACKSLFSHHHDTFFSPLSSQCDTTFQTTKLHPLAHVGTTEGTGASDETDTHVKEMRGQCQTAHGECEFYYHHCIPLPALSTQGDTTVCLPKLPPLHHAGTTEGTGVLTDRMVNRYRGNGNDVEEQPPVGIINRVSLSHASPLGPRGYNRSDRGMECTTR
jgi:hypothetical protein